jgi:predicted small secreted protein
MSENLFNRHKEFLMKSLNSALVAAALLLLVGCNTVKGMGQDLQKAGAKIEDVAKKN